MNDLPLSKRVQKLLFENKQMDTETPKFLRKDFLFNLEEFQIKKIFKNKKLENLTDIEKYEINSVLIKQFSHELHEELTKFDKPTPIQSISWPIALQKQNIVSIAKTGSGKSLAFIIPAILHIKSFKIKSRNGPRV